MLISHKYEVESQLGKGAMGIVYKVRHVSLGAISALKVLPSHLIENSDLLSRFYREARVMAKLIHPNIVRVIDIDHDEELNFHYFVMEYIHGKTLGEFLQEKKQLSLKEILRITRQIAHALQFAHENDPPVIHRDIKPANIMIEDKTERAVLMDFGIAKEMNESDMTRSEMMLGTVRYCPREQMLYHALDGSADIYALGMVMFEAYTGKHFFSGLNENQIISSVLSDKENQPKFDDNTPKEFITLISKAIAKSRDNRYKSVADFLVDLEKCWSVYFDKRVSKRIPVTNTDNITDLDEHIQMLEKEKQRRLAFANQKKCQEAKDKAVQEGGGSSINTLYKEACTLEETGNEYINQEKYSLAQDALQNAANLFSELYFKATQIKLEEQAQHIRQDIQTVKAEADDYHAKEKARTLYGRALSLQSQAEELLESACFKEALDIFSRAFHSFEDARELAYYQSQKEDCETLNNQVKDIFTDAVKVKAEEFATVIFREALANQQKAEAALISEEFSRAKELFQIALDNYSLARQIAISHQKQQALVAAQKQADGLWLKAKQAGAEQRFGDQFAEALKLNQQAQKFATQKELDQATDYFVKAAKAFEALQAEAETVTARENAEEIRQQLKTLHDDAKSLRTWAKDAWAEADRLTAEAESNWQQQQYPLAFKLYNQALEAHNQAQQKSIAAQINEQIQLLRTQLQESHQVADHCSITHYCQDLYRKAIDAIHQGETKLKNSLNQEALTDFKKAEAYYRQAIAQRHQQLEQDIIQAQQQAAEYQTPNYANTIYNNGQVLAAQAQGLWAQSLYAQSYDSYTQASQLLKDANEFACHRLQKEAAKTLQAKVREAFDAANSAEAQSLFSEQFNQAVENHKQADTAFLREDFSIAKKLYQQAIEQYASAQKQTLDKRRHQALEAKQQANEAQNLAKQTGVKDEQDVYQQAVFSYREGKEYFDQSEYTKALAAFKLAYEMFHRVQQETAYEQNYQIMLAAKEKAKEAYGKADALGAEHYFGVEYKATIHQLEQAKESVSQKNIEKAIGLYEAAANKLIQLCKETNSTITLQKIEGIRQRILEIENQLKPLISYAKKNWNEAEKIKKTAEKAFHAKDYDQALVKYEEAFHVYEHAKTEAGRKLDKLKQVNEEKKLKWLAYKSLVKSRLVSCINFIQRWTIKGLVVIALIAGGYAIVRVVSVKKLLDYLKPRSELEISKAVPTENEVSLENDQSQTFYLEVQDKEKYQLDYTWFLDGKEQAKGDQWDFKTHLIDQDSLNHEVKLVVTDRNGRRLEKTWAITIVHKPVEVNHPPEIIKSTPLNTELNQIKAGDSLDFSVEASDLDSQDPLTYLWLLDGKKVSTDKFWTFATPASAGTFTIVTQVIDHEGLQDQQIWHVTTISSPENHPPIIVKAEPSTQTITINQGDTINFAANAIDNDPKDQLTYEWAVNGQKVSTSKTWRYKSQEKGEHHITLSVSDKEKLQDHRTWDITTNPLSENHLPVIVDAKPSRQSIEVIQGDAVNFSVKATDKDPGDQLTYDWSVDGKKASASKTWHYKPQDVGDHDVILTVSDQKKLQVQQTWHITTNTPPENHPPLIVEAKPARQTIEIIQGDAVNFSVKASDKDPSDQLTYDWSVDGKKASTSKTWHYKPLAVGNHSVTLTVSDREHLQDKRTWKLTISSPPVNNPPVIVETEPSGQILRLNHGETISFSVKATDKDPGDRLTYDWTQDGQKASTSKSWRYKAQVEGQHTITVTVSDHENLQAKQNWTVNIESAPKPVASEKPKETQDTDDQKNKPANSLISEAEVKKWLENLRIYWENKNVARLVEMGGVDSSNASQLKQALERYNNFHVAFKNVDITIEGNKATVSFNRVDTIEDEILKHPDRKAFVLEKGPNGKLIVKK